MNLETWYHIVMIVEGKKQLQLVNKATGITAPISKNEDFITYFESKITDDNNTKDRIFLENGLMGFSSTQSDYKLQCRLQPLNTDKIPMASDEFWGTISMLKRFEEINKTLEYTWIDDVWLYEV